MIEPGRTTTDVPTTPDAPCGAAGRCCRTVLPGAARGPALRRVLWGVLVISVIGNSVASLATDSSLAHLGSGIVTGTCAAALLAPHLRGRGRA